MTLPFRLACLVSLVLALFGCAPTSYVVLIPSPDGSVGEVIVRGTKGEQVLNRAGQSATTDGSPLAVGEKKLAEDFSAAMAAVPKLPVRFLLYFTTGSTLTSESVDLIPQIVAETAARAAADVSVIGHTDTVYTSAYNDELALKRAQRVADLLREKGLRANTLIVEAHGKRNLLVPTPENTFEPRNRRVEVSVR